MKNVHKTGIAVGAAALVAVPTAIAISSAHADDDDRSSAVERSSTLRSDDTARLGTAVGSRDAGEVNRAGRCGGATYEFEADHERRGFELSAELDNARPGAVWRVSLTHDGKVVYAKNRTADREGEVELERNRPNTAGNDTFVFRAVEASTGKACTATAILR